MFALRGSYGENLSSERSSVRQPPIEKKQTSRKVVLAPRIHAEPSKDNDRFESSNKVNKIDGSAIENDGNNDWEDSNEAKFEETRFQRTDSRQNLTSHKSLLTIQLAHVRPKTGQPVQALSPCPHATRQNMLATELPANLRKQLLRERQQTSRTARAIPKRQHTAQDVADNFAPSAYWNEYFGAAGQYNSRGW